MPMATVFIEHRYGYDKGNRREHKRVLSVNALRYCSAHVSD